MRPMREPTEAELAQTADLDLDVRLATSEDGRYALYFVDDRQEEEPVLVAAWYTARELYDLGQAIDRLLNSDNASVTSAD